MHSHFDQFSFSPTDQRFVPPTSPIRHVAYLWTFFSLFCCVLASSPIAFKKPHRSVANSFVLNLSIYLVTLLVDLSMPDCKCPLLLWEKSPLGLFCSQGCGPWLSKDSFVLCLQHFFFLYTLHYADGVDMLYRTYPVQWRNRLRAVGDFVPGCCYCAPLLSLLVVNIEGTAFW